MLAIVLARRDWREYDQIITVYARRSGRLDLLAKGIKKITSKNSGNLFLGAQVDIDIAKGREIDWLIRVNPVEMYKNIRLDLSKQLLVSSALRLTTKLIKYGQTDKKVFEWLKIWLDFINNSQKVSKALLYSYAVVLVGLLGFRPELENCFNCKQKNDCKFNLSSGLVCAYCQGIDQRNLFTITKQEVENYIILLSAKLDKINQIKINPNLIKIIKSFIQYHTEIKLK